VRCKGVGTLAIDEEVFDVLNVALHSHFHVLLGVSDIVFIPLETRRLVYYNLVATLAFIRACLFVPAVAREVQGRFWKSLEMTVLFSFVLRSLWSSSCRLEKWWYNMETHSHLRDGNLNLTSQIILWIGFCQ
jgi:hypothetical protein